MSTFEEQFPSLKNNKSLGMYGVFTGEENTILNNFYMDDVIKECCLDKVKVLQIINDWMEEFDRHKDDDYVGVLIERLGLNG